MHLTTSLASAIKSKLSLQSRPSDLHSGSPIQIGDIRYCVDGVMIEVQSPIDGLDYFITIKPKETTQ